MKRIWLGLIILCAAAALGGCPIYSSPNNGATCDSNGQCFDCPRGSSPSDGTCVPWQCGTSSDCPAGYVCSAYSCVLETDASSSCDCPAGFICKLAGKQIECVPASSLGGDAAGVDSSADAAVVDGSSEASLDAGADSSRVSDASRMDAALTRSMPLTAAVADAAAMPTHHPTLRIRLRRHLATQTVTASQELDASTAPAHPSARSAPTAPSVSSQVRRASTACASLTAAPVPPALQASRATSVGGYATSIRVHAPALAPPVASEGAPASRATAWRLARPVTVHPPARAARSA